jgi:uncharacterized OB-fold protein
VDPEVAELPIAAEEVFTIRCLAPAKGGKGKILCGKVIRCGKIGYPRREFCNAACKMRADYYKRKRLARRKA